MNIRKAKLLLTFIDFLKVVLINMIAVLMISTELTTPGPLEVTLF